MLGKNPKPLFEIERPRERSARLTQPKAKVLPAHVIPAGGAGTLQAREMMDAPSLHRSAFAEGLICLQIQ